MPSFFLDICIFISARSSCSLWKNVENAFPSDAGEFVNSVDATVWWIWTAFFLDFSHICIIPPHTHIA